MFSEHGTHAPWDRPTSHLLPVLKKRFVVDMCTHYSGTTHRKPKAAKILVERVADKIDEEKLHIYRPDREGNSDCIPTTDTIKRGEEKLPTTSIPAFNKQLKALQQSRAYRQAGRVPAESVIGESALESAAEELEEDELPPMDLAVTDIAEPDMLEDES
jgi:hypothetical protein